MYIMYDGKHSAIWCHAILRIDIVYNHKFTIYKFSYFELPSPKIRLTAYVLFIDKIFKERRSRGFWAKITKITIYIFWMKRAWKIIKSQKKLKKVEKSPKKITIWQPYCIYLIFPNFKDFFIFHSERSNQPIFIGIVPK